MLDQLTSEWAEGLKERANNDPEFAVAGRLMQVDFLWEAGDTRLLFIVKEGKIDDIKLDDEITFNDSWDFSLRGSEKSWERFLSPTPPPMYNDIWAMVVQVDDVELHGNRLVAMQNIRALSHLMTLTRAQANGWTTVESEAEDTAIETQATSISDRETGADPYIEQIVGRYLHLRLDGADHRIYFEEAGQGIPPCLSAHSRLRL